MRELQQAIEGTASATQAAAAPAKNGATLSAPALSVMQLELRQASNGALELAPSFPEVQVGWSSAL